MDGSSCKYIGVVSFPDGMSVCFTDERCFVVGVTCVFSYMQSGNFPFFPEVQNCLSLMESRCNFQVHQSFDIVT